MITQVKSAVEVTSSLGENVLLLSSMTWSERLAQPFVGQLELVSEDPEVDLAALVGQPMAVRLDCRDQSRWLSGIVSYAQSAGAVGRLSRYRVQVASTFSLLQHSGGYRIYQNLTVPEIIQKVLSATSSLVHASRLSQSYTPREYCVQYGESDLQFLQRLMEEEGIYYFFEYTKDTHTIVLVDDASGHATVPDYDKVVFRSVLPEGDDEYICDYQLSCEVGTGTWILNDYDFQKPQSPLLVKQIAEQAGELSLYAYPGGYNTIDQGQRLARIRLEAYQASRDIVRMNSSVRGLRVGNTFTLTDHPLDSCNDKYLVKSLDLHVTAASIQAGDMTVFTCLSNIECQKASRPFRAPQVTSRPVALGPHLATVAGKQGEEIWTDSYGRVKVQFPWDLDGKNDEASSCWIRVSQTSVGKNWGSMNIPRIGDEVIVEFLNGNPDYPIVVGRVYNASRMPPEALSDAQAKTIFRTRSTKSADATAFHELTFDDTKDQEQILLHSERDFSRVVENNDALSVGFDKKSPGDRSVKVYNNETIEVGLGSGNGTYTLEAAKSILLKCGGSTIEITPDSIVLSSASITLKGNSEVNAQAPNVSLKADGALKMSGGATTEATSGGEMTIKGALVKIN